MIHSLIEASIKHRFIVLILALAMSIFGVYSIKHTPIDAIPDLSDVQVIVKAPYPGQPPQIVEDQVTRPLTTALMSVPKAKVVRGFSLFGDSYLYILFDDDTDLYWARSRVLEYLNQASDKLPEGITPTLGPDATGVGWVYIYALIDKTGKRDLSELRELQDWFLQFELQSLPEVAEVATIGGMEKEIAVRLNPQKLRAYKLSVQQVKTAITAANQSVGASVIEMSEAEYRVFSNGYLKTPEDFETIPLALRSNGTPILLSEVAEIKYEPALRRQVADLNGQGEATGGIIVMRFGENASETIKKVKQKLTELKKRLPKGVEIVEIYDRSKLINRAIDNLWQTLTIEWVIIGLVCLLFLGSISSALVAIVSLPIGILIAFCLMRFQDINANILSLGGIAIAIGTMIDGAIVMVEQAYRSVQKEQGTKPHWQIIKEASKKTGPAVFFSLLIITLSFLPIFLLEGQISRLFKPLAHTKTSAMLAAALLSITLVPVLLGFFLRKVKPANEKISKGARIYLSILDWVFNHPKITLTAFALLLLLSLQPASELSEEFMPPLDEGDWMYMPTMTTSISIDKAREVIQKAHLSIKQVPEVKHVFGKVGRADTVTDIAPLTMIESFVQLKPKNEWREGLTLEKLKIDLNQKVAIPGVTNAWVMPIKGRIDMLNTGIKTPLGLKISGPDLVSIEVTGKEIEKQLKTLSTTAQVYADKLQDTRYIAMEINRINAARYNLSVKEIQNTIQVAVNGQNVSMIIDNNKRFNVKLKIDRAYQSDIERLKQFPFITRLGKHLMLGDVVNIKIQNGPAMIKSENARLQSQVFIETQQTDSKSYIQQANRLFDTLEFPQGVTIEWAGQYQAFERLKEKLIFLVPLILLGIILLLWFSLRNVALIGITIISLPVGLAGSLWLVSSLDFALSVAVIVGIIAMAGIAMETVLIMLILLNDAWNDLEAQEQSNLPTIKLHQLQQPLKQAAVLRSRPLLMTVIADLAGLIPILLSSGTGSEIMQRLAAPMIGGLITTLLMTLILTPLLFYLFKSHSAKKAV